MSLESYEPELRSYLQHHSYPIILEVGGAVNMQCVHSTTAQQVILVMALLCAYAQALLTGLAVMIPDDPWEFMREKLSWLMAAGDDVHIHWYCLP